MAVYRHSYPAKHANSSRKQMHGKVDAAGIARMTTQHGEMVEQCMVMAEKRSGMAEKCSGAGWRNAEN